MEICRSPIPILPTYDVASTAIPFASSVILSLLASDRFWTIVCVSSSSSNRTPASDLFVTGETCSHSCKSSEILIHVRPHRHHRRHSLQPAHYSPALQR